MDRVLLINPNRYREPPVIPVGLECVADGLSARGFAVTLLDLCFEDEPFSVLDRVLDAESPAAAGLTLRNVDTALFPRTESFLPFVRDLTERLRGRGVPVVLGGAGLRADPEGIVRALGAELGIVGSGEVALPELLSAADWRSRLNGTVIEGRRPPPGQVSGRQPWVEARPYLAADGVAGFETHRGCSARCGYCIERGTPVWLRDPEAVINDLRRAVDKGFRRFHLLDPEFNEDEQHNRAVLEALVRSGLPIAWALYMRPGRLASGYFRLLRRSGAFLVTLTVDSAGRDAAYWRTVTDIVCRARAAGLRVAIDFLGAFPGEGEDLLLKSLDRLQGSGADDIVVNTMIRLYPSLPVTKIVFGAKDHQRHLVRGDGRPEPVTHLLEPVFYGRVRPEALAALVRDRAPFRLAGQERGVNYQQPGARTAGSA